MRVRTDVDNGVADRNPITPRASYPITHRGHRGEGARAVSRDPGGSPAPTIYGVREPAPALVCTTCLIRRVPISRRGGTRILMMTAGLGPKRGLNKAVRAG